MGQADSSDLKSAVLKGASGILGLTLFGNKPGLDSHYLCGISLNGTTGHTLYFPHVDTTSTGWTGITVMNPNDDPADLIITPYTGDGTAHPVIQRTLDGHEKLKSSIFALGISSEVAWIKVEASRPVTGLGLVGTRDNQQSAGYGAVMEPLTQGLFPLVESEGQTVLSLSNPEKEPAMVDLSAYDDSGTCLGTQTIRIGSLEQISDTPFVLFEADISGASQVRFSSDRPLAGCQVNNSGDNFLMDALAAFEVNEGTAGSLLTYPVVDTNQSDCYDTEGNRISCSASGEALYGQDANFLHHPASYTLGTDNLTVNDHVTGLTWTRSPDLNSDGVIDAADKLGFSQAQTYAQTLNALGYGGYSDWRLPTMKELYSIMDFNGTDPSGPSPSSMIPFVDTNFFEFAYGDESAGERLIDAQFWSSNAYVGKVFDNQSAAFGLNLADGRIKGYPSGSEGPVTKNNFVYFVRGNPEYGINDFEDNMDGTVTDHATGLMWSTDDSGQGMSWEEALAWVQDKNIENHLGYTDWRLPNAKEMQSLVDYSRSPDATGSAAIDPVFNITRITNEAGQADYPWFWTGTTHIRSDGSGSSAVYVCFGRAMGFMMDSWMDVHGAGAQRSDQKSTDFSNLTYVPDGYYFGNSPQGDATRVYNHVRLVRTSTGVSEVDDTGVYEGYTLFAPMGSNRTYLIENSGEAVHSWDSDWWPGLSVYLQPDGHLIKTVSLTSQVFQAGGGGGGIRAYDWEGKLVWDFDYTGIRNQRAVHHHHDIEVLPDGNILMIAWEERSAEEALESGRNPDLGTGTSEALWPDHIVEVAPGTGEIVWEWHVWDHLVQDYDPSKANYGSVAGRPERINVNYTSGPGGSDWTHFNSLDYNAELDQILISVRSFNEIWIIDHSTTTEEARGSVGGASGKGGDLLYRWGNPAAYNRGDNSDQQLFGQHDARWIDPGCPGEGHIMIFNNGNRSDRPYSTVVEIDTPKADTGYIINPEDAYGPDSPVWTYDPQAEDQFFADHISGSQRLPNGNTLICDGPAGHFIEVTSSGQVVWEYTNPYVSDLPGSSGQAGSEVFRAEKYSVDFAAFAGM
ncbi:MAG: DUF1566 domain-containing protein [Desulfobacteraceae bacterium]|nr:MAG: DUF1566 domain-containing protein [Desulfobacteraceae bacterium]